MCSKASSGIELVSENGLGEDMKTTSKYILNQLEWTEMPPITAQPPNENMLAKAWPLNRRVPLFELFTSMGLEPPTPMPVVAGAAPPDSRLAPADDDEEEIDDTDHPEDFPIAAVSPLSDDDVPLVAS